MKCTICLTDLIDPSDHVDKHNAGVGERFINLRCINTHCVSQTMLWTTFRICIPESGNWTCDSYMLPIRIIKGRLYSLFGNSKGHTKLIMDYENPNPKDYSTLIDIPFISLPLTSDMPHKAEELFDRLMKLVIFS